MWNKMQGLIEEKVEEKNKISALHWGILMATFEHCWYLGIFCVIYESAIFTMSHEIGWKTPGT